MKELLIHPSFIKVGDEQGTFARANKLENGMWNVKTHRIGPYQLMTEIEAKKAMEIAALLVALS